MKRSTRSSAKKASNISESVVQHLNMYAIAAGAAGVSVLALAQPTEAKIKYTPMHVVIRGNQNYNLDLNHDGIADFIIQNADYSGYCSRHPFKGQEHRGPDCK